MDNNDLLMILGIGLTCVGLALVLPVSAARPLWLPVVLGVAGAVAGLLTFLTVLFR